MRCNLVERGSLLVNPLCLALRREKIENRMFSQFTSWFGGLNSSDIRTSLKKIMMVCTLSNLAMFAM